jgi:hypothetical protein
VTGEDQSDAERRGSCAIEGKERMCAASSKQRTRALGLKPPRNGARRSKTVGSESRHQQRMTRDQADRPENLVKYLARMANECSASGSDLKNGETSAIG